MRTTGTCQSPCRRKSQHFHPNHGHNSPQLGGRHYDIFRITHDRHSSPRLRPKSHRSIITNDKNKINNNEHRHVVKFSMENIRRVLASLNNEIRVNTNVPPTIADCNGKTIRIKLLLRNHEPRCFVILPRDFIIEEPRWWTDREGRRRDSNFLRLSSLHRNKQQNHNDSLITTSSGRVKGRRESEGDSNCKKKKNAKKNRNKLSHDDFFFISIFSGINNSQNISFCRHFLFALPNV